jgi:hypothetical protein
MANGKKGRMANRELRTEEKGEWRMGKNGE